MKKTFLYLVVAAILGVLITVVPLIAVAETGIGGNKQHAISAPPLVQGLKKLDGGGSSTSQINRSDLIVLVISLIVAFLAYNLFGRRAPRRYDLLLRFPPH